MVWRPVTLKVVERPCYQCGLVVEDFVTFCPQCRAPQIRVVSTVPEPQPASIGVLRKVEFSAPAKLGQLKLGQSKINWSHALPSAILAVLVVALFNSALFGAPGLLLCGALCVIFYRQQNKQAIVSRLMGMKLGAISGILATAVTVIFHFKVELKELAAQGLQASLDRSTDEVSKQIIRNFVAQHPNAFPIMLVIFMGVLFLIISGLGGMMGASLMNRWRPQINLTSSDSQTKLEQREKTERSEHD